MAWTNGMWLRWRSLFQGEQVSRELEREIQFHLDQQIAEAEAQIDSARQPKKRLFELKRAPN